jgi:hypothetical protein
MKSARPWGWVDRAQVNRTVVCSPRQASAVIKRESKSDAIRTFPSRLLKKSIHEPHGVPGPGSHRRRLRIERIQRNVAQRSVKVAMTDELPFKVVRSNGTAQRQVMATVGQRGRRSRGLTHHLRNADGVGRGL